jgi:O-methyltransferase
MNLPDRRALGGLKAQARTSARALSRHVKDSYDKPNPVVFRERPDRRPVRRASASGGQIRGWEMKSLVRGVIRSLGFDIVRYRPRQEATTLPSDLGDDDRAILERIAGYTLTSVERQVALIQAARHVVRRGIPGCLVECGVWRGGSSMAVAMALAQEGDTSRDLYLFDTFEGMSPPTEADRTSDGTLARTHLERDVDRTGYWCVAGIGEVTKNMASTGYPHDRIHLVKGPVEATVPSRSPQGPVALLRLDTDWYESTKHELVHLFPLLSEGGALIIDDYGHWEGARRAVDEYLADQPRQFYLHRIDYTGRLLIKQ